MQKSIFICISCFYQAGEMNYSIIIRGEKKKKVNQVFVLKEAN